MFVCTTCDKKWEAIPDNAVQLTNPGRGPRIITYRFSDGTIHSLRRVKTMEQKHRYHRTKKLMCHLCYPGPEDNYDAKQAQPLAVPQTQAATEPIGEPANHHDPGSNGTIPIVLDSKEVEPTPDIEVLAARLRKRFMNEQLDESEWTEDSIAKI